MLAIFCMDGRIVLERLQVRSHHVRYHLFPLPTHSTCCRIFVNISLKRFVLYEQFFHFLLLFCKTIVSEESHQNVNIKNVQRNAVLDVSLCTYTAYHIFFCFQYLVWFLFYFVVFNGTSIDGANGKGQRLYMPKDHCFHQQKLQVRTISQISLVQHSKPSDLLSNSSQVLEPFKAMIPDI